MRMEYDMISEQELLRAMRRVRSSQKRKRLLWGLLIWSALAAAAGWFVFDRYYMVALVPGVGMEDTIRGNSLVLCQKMTEKTHAAVGDAVLFSKGDGMQLKRVAAVGGDGVMMSLNGCLLINGTFWKDAAWNDAEGSDMRYHPVTVPEGELFVVNDRLSLTADSRSSDFGTVKESTVLGKLEAVLWPPYQLTDTISQLLGRPAADEGVNE